MHISCLSEEALAQVSRVTNGFLQSMILSCREKDLDLYVLVDSRGTRTVSLLGVDASGRSRSFHSYGIDHTGPVTLGLEIQD